MTPKWHLQIPQPYKKRSEMAQHKKNVKTKIRENAIKSEIRREGRKKRKEKSTNIKRKHTRTSYKTVSPCRGASRTAEGGGLTSTGGNHTYVGLADRISGWETPPVLRATSPARRRSISCGAFTECLADCGINKNTENTSANVTDIFAHVISQRRCYKTHRSSRSIGLSLYHAILGTRKKITQLNNSIK